MVSVAQFDALAEKIDNAGRWGARDERGTLNLVTPEVLRKAAAAVETGEVVSLAMGLSLDGPQNGVGVPGRVNPVRTMLGVNVPMGPGPDAVAWSDDIVFTPVQAATHWDALSHVSHRGLMYNGFPAGDVDSAGAHRLAMEAAGPIVSRGILLDVARHRGVERLPRGTVVGRDLLAEVEEAQGSPVEEGDILLIRTGQAGFMVAGDVAGYRERPNPALDWDAPLFFHERGVAAAATDNMSFEVLPSAVPELVLPVHVLCLVHLGMPQGQNFVLDELGAACARDRRYTFHLSATPEPFLRSTGGMVHPVALR
jgi:hypothetical protein